VALIGARRRRQGLGPFVARQLASHGATVVAHLGTRPETVAAAGEELRSLAGVNSPGYVDFEQLLAEQRPEALAILAPAEHHASWLRRALDHDLAVLCEKPLVWGDDDPAGQARTLVGAFAERGLLLHENCQWPLTIPTWDALFPGARQAPPRRFDMTMSPARPGLAMLADSMSHPLSLLQELAPGLGALPTDVRFSSTAQDAAELEVRFSWPAETGPVEATVRFALGPEQPREAGWGLDGRYAQRLIRAHDYAQFLASGARLVDLPDPLGLLVGRFVDALRGDHREDRADAAARMIQRMDALSAMRDAWQADSR